VVKDTAPSSSGGSQFEGPKESADLSEVRATSNEFVNKIFNADKLEFAQVLFNDAVVGNGDSLLVDLPKSSLVDELSNGLQVGITISNVWLDQSEHLSGCLGQFDEHSIVNLSQSQELQDLSGLGVESVDTSDSNNKSDLCFRVSVEVSSLFSLSSELNK